MLLIPGVKVIYDILANRRSSSFKASLKLFKSHFPYFQLSTLYLHQLLLFSLLPLLTRLPFATSSLPKFIGILHSPD